MRTFLKISFLWGLVVICGSWFITCKLSALPTPPLPFCSTELSSHEIAWIMSFKSNLTTALHLRSSSVLSLAALSPCFPISFFSESQKPRVSLKRPDSKPWLSQNRVQLQGHFVFLSETLRLIGFFIISCPAQHVGLCILIGVSQFRSAVFNGCLNHVLWQSSCSTICLTVSLYRLKNPVTDSQWAEFSGVHGRGNVGLSPHLEMVWLNNWEIGLAKAKTYWCYL